MNDPYLAYLDECCEVAYEVKRVAEDWQKGVYSDVKWADLPEPDKEVMRIVVSALLRKTGISPNRQYEPKSLYEALKNQKPYYWYVNTNPQGGK